MKKPIAAAFVVSALMFTLVGCSSNYVLHTNDGRTLVAQGKPSVDDDTGMMVYKDSNGNKQQINRSDVKDMTEVGQ